MVVARFDDGNRALDLGSDLANPWPAGRCQHKNCYLATGQILLIANVGVSSDQQPIALLFRKVDQLAIGNCGPAKLIGRRHKVVTK